ncbi:replication initiator protein A [Rhodoplanes sp. TEM]|uniref:Replication initiator protein A n=1 Tax=Rhodoplanes tepidamans TaxID=200616 RepID=A0ABT5J6P4_RHOTP|nr:MULTISPECIES: replication initiator protein A [Rhodoplanes]MDC7785107.1 replication initiator protein A [Rhodoplanes tepidamans]MDC7982581.1 replication initiator protein A [Rhodoplanes sp. TEM]MDQ0356597.1 hypothetical protein [Rhodoplanes tepidamans]
MRDGMDAFREALECRVGPEAFRSWFTGVQFNHEAEVLAVHAPTDFVARTLRSEFEVSIQEEARCAFGEKVTVEIVVPSGTPARAAQTEPLAEIFRAVAPNDNQRDFFVPDLTEVAIKDEVHLMEMTPFTLNKSTETRSELVYVTPQGLTLRVKAGADRELPSVEDYDLVLMMQSWLADMANQYRTSVEQYEAEKRAGKNVAPPALPPRSFDVSISEVVKFKRMKWGGHRSEDVLDGLRRLVGAVISVDPLKGSKYRGGEFHLIDKYDILAKTPDGKASRLRIDIPNWTYEGIVERAVPTLRTYSRDYMILAQPLHRALYRLLSLKVPKDSTALYVVSLVELGQRFQTRQTQKYFNRTIKGAVEACQGRLLGFRLELVGQKDDRALRAWRELPGLSEDANADHHITQSN